MIVDSVLLLLKCVVLIFAMLIVPVAILVATPLILLWPTAHDGNTWGQVVKSRYSDVVKTAWEFVELLAAI